MPVDREMVARTVGELRAALPEADDLLAGLLRVGTLDAYSTQPRTWSAHELEAMREFAVVAGELVHTSVELASRELELAQLRQALTNRVWIEQAKGVLAATQGSDPEVAFRQLRTRARASSRKLADLAHEVVQDAQRRRLAALAAADERDRAADDRDRIADERDRVAGERDRTARHPD